MLHTPVALFIFNRPKCSRQLYLSIAQIKPSRLFIVADGPRFNDNKDKELCRETRAIFNTIEWPCNVTRIYSDINLGCRNSIPNGLNQIFEHVEECIILEDDCIPEQSFYSYCEELLDKYRNEEKIISIGGHRSDGPNEFEKESYFFSKYPSIWGWATWRHKWQMYDLNMTEWDRLRNTTWLFDILQDDVAVQYWKRMFDEMQNGMDTWDYALNYSTWYHNALSIRPKVNMITNIGFGRNATHTKSSLNNALFPKAGDIKFPLHHPIGISVDDDAEKRIEWVNFSGMDKRIVENARLKILSHRKKLEQ